MTDAVYFDLSSILGVTHGYPVCGDEQRTILEFLIGSSVAGPVHGLLIRDVCRVWLVELHPVLTSLPPRPPYVEGVDYTAVDGWLMDQVTAVGVSALPLRPVPPERVDPGNDTDR